MRGRLIFPFKAEIFRLDTVATAAVTPDAGVFSKAGFDDSFSEATVKAETATDKIGKVQRKEQEPILVPCQVKSLEFQDLRQTQAGDVPDSEFTLAFHHNGLKALKLLDPDTGLPTFNKHDRLARILDKCDNLVTKFPRNGLFVVEVKPSSYGLGLGQNLFIVSFEERQVGTVS